jgi:hypothetical protein
MRLLDTRTLEIHEFLGDIESQQFPRYAILSHTWGEGECSLRDMSLPEVTQKAGFKKIKFCCDQAVKDGLQWVWVDTCCIDKTSTAELSEAINSMFQWYRQSAICYVYLADVQHTDGLELAHSRWLTRGWTLQELIAPADVRFYDQSWCFIGLKSERSMQECLTGATGIEASILLGGPLEYVPIARKMSWAANRSTTRVEDAAYCLLGLFDVNMPLLYGEGKKAFRRLQQEIMKVSEDHSLFAWGLEAQPMTLEAFQEIAWSTSLKPSHGLLAESAADFKICRGIHPIHDLQSDVPPVFTDNGLQIRLPIVRRAGISCAAVSCTMDNHLDYYLAIPLIAWGSRYTARCASPVLVRSNLVKEKSLQTVLVKRASDIQPPKVRPGYLEIQFGPHVKVLHPHIERFGPEARQIEETWSAQRMGELLLPQHATRSKDGMITLNNIEHKTDVPHAVLVIDGQHSLGLVFGGNLECRDGIWCAALPLLKKHQLQNGENIPIPSLLREYDHKLIVTDPQWYITHEELEDRLLWNNKMWASLPSMAIIDGQRSRMNLGTRHEFDGLPDTGRMIETFLTVDFQFKSLDLVSSGHCVMVSLEEKLKSKTGRQDDLGSRV